MDVDLFLDLLLILVIIQQVYIYIYVNNLNRKIYILYIDDDDVDYFFSILYFFNLDINVIVDSIVQQSSNLQIPIGGKHFDQYLLTLLKEDQDLVQQCKEANIEIDETFARFIRESNIYHVAFGHSLQQTATSQVESDLGGAPAATMEEIADNETSNEDEDEPVDIPDVEEIEYNGHKVRNNNNSNNK